MRNEQYTTTVLTTARAAAPTHLVQDSLAHLAQLLEPRHLLVKLGAGAVAQRARHAKLLAQLIGLPLQDNSSRALTAATAAQSQGCSMFARMGWHAGSKDVEEG